MVNRNTVARRIMWLLSPFVTGMGQFMTVTVCAIAGQVVAVVFFEPYTYELSRVRHFRFSDFFGVLVGGAVGYAWIVVASLAFAFLDLYNDRHPKP